MKETGILFTPDNIRAILAGRKTQTRRIINPQPTLECTLTEGIYPPTPSSDAVVKRNGDHWEFSWPNLLNHFLSKHCHYGVEKDLLYIKEGVIVSVDSDALIGYYMDGARARDGMGTKRLTAMFMAKRYARTWLEITKVRAERLQEISEEDAKAEGSIPDTCKCDRYELSLPGCEGCANNYRRGYEKLWDSINGKSHPWKNNDFVWAISFRSVTP